MSTFRLIQHLLPSGAAWSVENDKPLRRFFLGMSRIGDTLKTFVDRVFLDIFPDDTRRLDDWESQFALPDTGLTEAQRRVRLAETWQAVGGQSPGYIENILHAHGFTDLTVHGWIDPLLPVGADGRYPARDPRTYLTNTGEAEPGGHFPVQQDRFRPVRYFGECGQDNALCGVTEIECGNGLQIVTVRPGRGYLLVNERYAEPTPFRYVNYMGQMDLLMGKMGEYQGDFTGTREHSGRIHYAPTADPDTWPFYAYVGPSRFSNLVEYPRERKAVLDELLLRLMPQHLWIGVFVEYS